MNSQFHRNSSMQPFVQFHDHFLSNQIIQHQKIEMGKNRKDFEVQTRWTNFVRQNGRIFLSIHFNEKRLLQLAFLKAFDYFI